MCNTNGKRVNMKIGVKESHPSIGFRGDPRWKPKSVTESKNMHNIQHSNEIYAKKRFRHSLQIDSIQITLMPFSSFFSLLLFQYCVKSINTFDKREWTEWKYLHQPYAIHNNNNVNETWNILRTENPKTCPISTINQIFTLTHSPYQSFVHHSLVHIQFKILKLKLIC